MNSLFRKIQTKILLAFLALISLIAVVGLVTFLYQKNINQYHSYKETLNDLRQLTTQVNTIQKDFLMIDASSENYMIAGKSKTTRDLSTNIRETKKNFDALKRSPITQEFRLSDKIEQLSLVRDSYNRSFGILQQRIKERGFKGYGLEGSMRNYAHFLEDINNILVLEIRKHEKDFFLRKDLNYSVVLHQKAEMLKKDLAAGTLQEVDKAKFVTYVNDYEKLFDKIVLVETEIGLESRKGLRGEMNNIYEKLDAEIQEIYQTISFRIENLIFQAQLIVASAIVVILITGIFFSIYFSYSISRPIVLLNQVSQMVVDEVEGQEDIFERIQNNDEVGDLSKNFKIMLTKLGDSIKEAEDRNEQLKSFVSEEYKRNWENEGLALFGDILKNNNNDLQKQSSEIISTLVKYTGSTQGGLFIVNSEKADHQFLELKASYAYERKKSNKKVIEFGEGILGATWREGDTKLITDIPQDYLHITSGVGVMNPTSLLIVPLKSDEKIEGIIEIASLKQYEVYQIEFIERLSRRIAANISAVKANERNVKLLYTAEDFSKQIEAKDVELLKRMKDHQQWMQQYEQKLNSLAEESHIYQYVLNKIYDGIIITDEKFSVVKVNNYILRKFRYKRSEIEGQSVDVLIETNYKNIIDLKEKKFQLNYRSFQGKSTSKIIDHYGNQHFVQMMAGKMEIDTKIVYIFLFNELSSEELTQMNRERGQSSSENSQDVIY